MKLVLFLFALVSCSVSCSGDENGNVESCIEAERPTCSRSERLAETGECDNVECRTVTGTGACEVKIECTEDEGNYDACTDLGKCVDVCKTGYKEATAPCADGVNGCVLQDAIGGDLGYLACTCENSCPGFAVQSCQGDPDCTPLQACGETLYCTKCDDAACADNEILVPSCGSDENYLHASGRGIGCRPETCNSNPSVSYGCAAVYECKVECPQGMTACQSASATCISTPSCASSLLCEAL